MYQVIKSQYDTGTALTHTGYGHDIRRDLWPKFHWDLYPIVNDYYHELNPYYVYNLYSFDMLETSKAITVRDGFLQFAAFLVTNLQKIPEADQHFLIHPALTPIVPPHLRKYFSAWKISQPKKLPLKDAKKVIIFGLVGETYLGEIEGMAAKLSPLKEASPETLFELYLPIRKEPFLTNHRESVMHYQLLDVIKDVLPGRKFKFINNEDFFEIGHFGSTYFFDLADDLSIVADNYLHFHVASRGGAVNLFSTEVPKDSYFDLALSFNHQLHVCPLPTVGSIFMELLLYSKRSSVKDLTLDNIFHTLVREQLKKHP
ncbi:MAG TPA: hypothetical protein VNJ01_07890 [Bacteriovoracaceae bacterium]|nr:hypothetical protein [Bacteriovoracaceae bacterium]